MNTVDQKPKRLIALDVFRGMTIMGMILVNNPGSWSHIYDPLKHAPWHGWTPTDFIFPFFLFIVGVAMALSLAGRIERGDTGRALYLRIFRRVLLLFAIGLALNLYPKFNFAEVRILGVLQRIAICYLAVALIMLTSSKKAQIYWAGGLLIVYWVLLTCVPVPGYGAGDLSAAGNICTYVDSIVLAGHTWAGAPVPGFDPEGILSTLAAIATTLFGVFTGYWLRSRRDQLEKVTVLFVWGAGGLAAGNIMSLFMPINKDLWTPSYAVFMSGMALVFLAMSIWIIDIKGFSRWAKPFIIFGSNAILVFTLSSLTARILVYTEAAQGESVKEWLFTNLFASWADSINASLLFAVSYTLIWLGVSAVFYRKNIFLKV